MSLHITLDELQIVNNILDKNHGFLKYRNLEYIPDTQEVNHNLQFETFGYTTIRGKNSDGGVVVVCIIANQEEVIKNKSNILTTFKSKTKLDITSAVVNIIFIVHNMYYKPNVITVLKELFSDVKCNVYPYSNFVLCIPFCSEVPKHTILTPKEAEELLTLERISISGLPLIYETDPPIVWLGAKKGDIIKIDNFSLTSINTVSYRRVV
jgi:DNA-directed RNA polymerase subunit H (RpoH/RPB5)